MEHCPVPTEWNGSGRIVVSGTPRKLLMDGAIYAANAGLTIDFTQVSYHLNDSIRFKNDVIRFDRIEMKDVLVDAHKIQCPVYVLGFDLKKIGLNYPINLSEEMARYYRARDYQVIEPGGHMFMLERNWEEFARLIEKWLLD